MTKVYDGARAGSAMLAERIEQELHESGTIYECPGCGRELDTKPPANEDEWLAPAKWCRRCGGTAETLSATARDALFGARTIAAEEGCEITVLAPDGLAIAWAQPDGSTQIIQGVRDR